MNNILDDYSQEEIEALALKQLESDSDKKIEETSMSIIKIDKEYKKHNSNAVKKAIFNGSVILLCAGIFLNSDPNILEFGSEDLTFLYENEILILLNQKPMEIKYETEYIIPFSIKYFCI